jgi:hypothetical protein
MTNMMMVILTGYYGTCTPQRKRQNKIRLHVAIPEGKIRHVVPVVAAKFATECNVRNHVPVFKHWKDYKNQSALFDLFKRKLSVSALSRSSPPLKLLASCSFSHTFHLNRQSLISTQVMQRSKKLVLK